MIQPTGTVTTDLLATVTNANTTATKTQIETATKQEEKKTDSFVKSDCDLTQLTYSKPKKTTSAEVNALLEQHQQQIEAFKQSILSMITKQGEVSNVKVFGLNLTVTPEQALEAKQSIEEGGEWSVDAVATRIMDMAYALSGGDSSKLELLKNAVISGFKAAGFDPSNREQSQMPEITGQTYDEVMKRFDDWANQSASATQSTANGLTYTEDITIVQSSTTIEF